MHLRQEIEPSDLALGRSSYILISDLPCRFRRDLWQDCGGSCREEMERIAAHGLMVAALLSQLGMSLPWTSDEVAGPIVVTSQSCNDTDGQTTCETPIAKSGKTQKHDPYDREGSYGLVPAFLIGAASVVVIYVTIHCLYIHCYAKKRMTRLMNEQQNDQQAQTILVKDGTATFHPVTPIVKYEGGYGKTEVVKAAPYIMYNPENEHSITCPHHHHHAQSATRKHRRAANAPNLLRTISRKLSGKGNPQGRCPNSQGRCRGPRRSPNVPVPVPEDTASEQGQPAATVDSPNPNDAELNKDEFTPPRASICFVPVNRSASGTGSNNAVATEWTPLKGYMYSTVLLSHRTNPDGTSPQRNISDTAEPEVDTSAPPIVIIPPEEWERHVNEDYLLMSDIHRKVDPNIPDVCEQLPYNIGHKSITDIPEKVLEPVEESSPDTEREHAASLIHHLVQVHDT
jgi:hypothetical protein